MNAYRLGASAEAKYLKAGAYGLSVLWKGFGSDYDTASSLTWGGAYKTTGPSGMQCAINGGHTAVSLPVPNFSVPREQVYVPHAVNANGQSTLMLSAGTAAYVSGLVIEMALYSSPHHQAMLTYGADIAAHTANHGKTHCVVCIGTSAVDNIESEAGALGISLKKYSTFSGWEAGAATSPGYIAAVGTSQTDTYSKARIAVLDAATAGWG